MFSGTDSAEHDWALKDVRANAVPLKQICEGRHAEVPYRVAGVAVVGVEYHPAGTTKREVVPAGQHWAPTQPPEAQTAPQDPQLFGSVEVSVHWSPQMVTATKGTPGQVWHRPKVQVLTASQVVPHRPQLLRSVLVSVQFP